MSSTLNEFRDLIMDINDEELLDVAESLLKDMIQIQDMKERVETLEEGLSKGNRAAFWFFAMGLDREQIDPAPGSTQTIVSVQADDGEVTQAVATGVETNTEPAASE